MIQKPRFDPFLKSPSSKSWHEQIGTESESPKSETSCDYFLDVPIWFTQSFYMVCGIVWENGNIWIKLFAWWFWWLYVSHMIHTKFLIHTKFFRWFSQDKDASASRSVATAALSSDEPGEEATLFGAPWGPGRSAENHGRDKRNKKGGIFYYNLLDI